MSKLSAHEMAGHPLVRLIDDASECDDDDPTGWNAVDDWLEQHADEAVPLLIQLATDRALLHEQALAGGEVPIVATYMLGQYQDPSAVEPLLDVLCSMPRAYPDLLQWDALWSTLQDLADDVAGPAIERYQRSDGNRHRAVLATLLGDLGVKTPDAYTILTAELPHRPCLMAGYLGEYGDERALPLLLETFDETPWSSSGEFGERYAGQPMLDLCDAITALSGTLSRQQWQTYERAWKLRAPTQPPPSIVPPPNRSSSPGHVSPVGPAMLTACTVSEFYEKALIHYGTLRNTAAMIDSTPANVFHSAVTCVGIL